VREVLSVTMSHGPPIVPDLVTCLSGYPLPQYDNVVMGFIQSALLLYRSFRQELYETVSGGFSCALQSDQAYAKPAGIGIRRVIEL
jgi:hypothetical protein